MKPISTKSIFCICLLMLLFSPLMGQDKAQLTVYRENPGQALQDAQKSFSSGDYKKAKTLANFYLSLSKDADKSAGKALRSSAKQCLDLQERALEHEAADEFSAAADCYKRILDINPGDSRAKRNYNAAMKKYSDSNSNASTWSNNLMDVDREQVINTIKTHTDAYVSNDFDAISRVYASQVTRYHNAYNLTNQEVVGKYRDYDQMFGVYAKHASIRWNTLQIERLSAKEISVVFVEDYSIDRADNSKYSIFVLEEHLVLDEDYKIKSIYDVQLEKRKK